MKTLIPLSDFVLEQKRKTTSETDYVKPLKLIFNYTEFLKQPLTLGMFVPCDYEGNVLKNPHARDEDAGTDKEFLQTSYNNALEKVLFKSELRINKTPYKSTKRFLIDLLVKNDSIRLYTELQYHNGEIDKQYFPNREHLTIQDLVSYGLILTPSALQAIGLNK